MHISYFDRFKIWLFALAIIMTALSRSLALDAQPPMSILLPAEHHRLALLVGISDYSNGTNRNDGFETLKTKSDLVNLQSVLKQYFDFDNIKVLHDADATQANIKDMFQSFLVGQAQPGDDVVFYYTGHGHYTPALHDPAEVDGFDEVLVTWLPPSVRNNPDRQARYKDMYLIDDDIGVMLKALSDKMQGKGTITVIFDSCHSGDGIKGNLVPKDRPYDPQLDGPVRPSSRKSASGWLDAPSPPGVVFMSACQSGQQAYMLDDGSLFTTMLAKALTEVGQRHLTNITNRDLFEWVSVQTLAQHVDQDPQIEGAIDAPLFGEGSSHEVQRYLLVSDPSNGHPMTVTLSNGRLQGVSYGSSYDIYRPGTDTTIPANKIAQARITLTTALTSQATIDKQLTEHLTADDLIAARAVETNHAYDGEPLKVIVLDDNGLANKVSALPFVAKGQVSLGNFDVKVASDSTRQGFMTYTRADGQTSEISEPVDFSSLTSRLAAEWRWRHLASLRPISADAPKIRIQIVSDNQDDNGKPIPLSHSAGGRLLLKPGDQAHIICTNDSDQDLFMSLIYLKANGDIVAWPRNPLAQQSIPHDHLPHQLVPIKRVNSPVGGSEIEMFKLIATPVRTDFSAVNFSKDARSLVFASSPLQKFLFGLADCDAKDVVFGDDTTDEYGVADIVYQIVSK